MGNGQRKSKSNLTMRLVRTERMIELSLSNEIAHMLLDMLEASGETEIRRNELAQTLGCVPSQINYVISSRFTPEQGYIVESRRGGGGSIKITRVKLDSPAMLMHAVNSIGERIDYLTCRAYILNLGARAYFSPQTANLMLSALSDNALRCLPPELRDTVRASILKQMLLALNNSQP